jgi:hypothetical protein
MQITIPLPGDLTPAQKTKWSAYVSGVSGAISYLLTLTPSAQNAVLAPIIGILPPGWLGYVGTLMKALSIASLIYAFVSAHKGTPLAQMPPADVEALATKILATKAVAIANGAPDGLPLNTEIGLHVPGLREYH